MAEWVKAPKKYERVPSEKDVYVYVGPNRGLAMAIQLSVYFELGHVLNICPMHLNRNSGLVNR